MVSDEPRVPFELAEIAKRWGMDPKQLLQALQKGKEDPVHWIELSSGHKLWRKQKQIVRAFQKRRVVCVPTANGVGKSYIAAQIVVWAVNNWYPLFCATTAPTDRQVKEILWKEIRRAYRDSRIPLAGTPDMQQLKVYEDQRAMGFTASEYNPNLFMGMREGLGTTVIVFDEACGIADPIYEGAISIMGAGARTRLLQLGNPVDPITPFKEQCDDPATEVITISAFDTPNFNIPGHELTEANFLVNEEHPDHWTSRLGPHWHAAEEAYVNLPTPYLTTPHLVQDLLRKYGQGSPQYVARVLGRFPEQSEDALLSLSELDDAQDPEHPLGSQPSSEPVDLAVDVAYRGSNMTVVAAHQAPFADIVDAWAKADTTETANRVERIVRDFFRHGVPVASVKIDVIGYGAGVYDQLMRRGLPTHVMAFDSANRDVPEGFLNQRAHAYWLLRERFEERRIVLPARTTRYGEQLRKELLTIKKKLSDVSTDIQIIGKEEMRRAGIQSPDFADALMMACYEGSRPAGDTGFTV